jgi:hypothetical protein
MTVRVLVKNTIRVIDYSRVAWSTDSPCPLMALFYKATAPSGVAFVLWSNGELSAGVCTALPDGVQLARSSGFAKAAIGSMCALGGSFWVLTGAAIGEC